MKENKQKILRYAELTFKLGKLNAQGQSLTSEEEKERSAIPVELGMSHEKILDRVAKNLIEEKNC